MEIEDELSKKILHDLKSPVSIVEMYITLLKEELEDDGILEKYKRECFVIKNSAKLMLEILLMMERMVNIEEIKKRVDEVLIKEIIKKINKKNIKGYNITGAENNIYVNEVEFIELLNIILECLWGKIGVKNIFFDIEEKKENMVFKITFDDPKSLINIEGIFNKTNKNIVYLKEKATGLEFLYLKKFIDMYNGTVKAEKINNIKKRITLILKKGD